MSQELIQKWEVDETWTLFLDRDGVINHETFENYITCPDEFIFINGALEALQKLSKVFSRIIIVTNQQGVGKGVMSEKDLEAVNTHMINEVTKVGGRIDAVYCATELRGTIGGLRKPNRAMADLAKKDFPEIDFKKSIMVGNSNSDMEFGKNLGMKVVFIGEGIEQTILVLDNLHSLGEILRIEND